MIEVATSSFVSFTTIEGYGFAGHDMECTHN